MFLRLILGIAVLLAAAWVARRMLSANRPQDGSSDEPPGQFRPTVACARCGTFLPRDNAIEVDGEFYCCSDHADPDQ